MTVLNFMSEIAYGDFARRLPPKKYHYPGYDEVEILTWRTVSARYLLWGVWLAAEYMMNHHRFQAVLLGLRWEETVLGTIKIQPAPSRPRLPGRSSNVQRLSSAPPSNGSLEANPRVVNTNNTSAPDLPISTDGSLDAQFEVSIDSLGDGKSLTRYEVFMLCYTALLHCAQTATTEPIQSFGIRSPIGDDVALEMFRHGPSLAYTYVIQALSYIPGSLLQDPLGFREIVFDLDLDGALCARGAITKGRV